MGDISERSASHGMRREQERERRRMRDRERRQSMTLEQREKHLARRRKNYQLRRQRIKNLEYGYQSGPPGTASSGEASERYEQPVEYGSRCKDIVPVGFDQVVQKIETECSKPEGTESLAYDLATLRKRLRLNHVKHFARSLKRPLSEFNGSNQQIVADLVTKGNPSANGKTPQGVRLNRFKRLARTVNSASKETSHEQHGCETNAQSNLVKGEVHTDTHSANSKIQIQAVAGEDKVNYSDSNPQFKSSSAG